MPLPIRKPKERSEEENLDNEVKRVEEIAPEVKPAEVKPEAVKEVEAPLEKVEEVEEVVEEKQPTVEGEKPAAAPPPATPKPDKSETLEAIEDILEEDMAGFYQQLPPKKQEEFKEEGEETASKIENLVQKTKIKTRKIMDLIVGWLKLIPGVNKFFLEKEAKIKTEKILKFKEQEEKEKQEE